MSAMGVAVWGLGLHAINKILPALSATNGLQLYGVCSRDAGKVFSCSQKWKCKGWTDADTMLGDSNVEVIYVATPIGLHFDHGRQVLNARKHLWCEKPLTSHLAHTLELLESAKSQGLSICEGLMYLHHPQFRQLSQYVSNGQLGPIKSVGCRFGIPKLEQMGFRSDPSLGGGAFFDVGCYPVSVILALFPKETLQIDYASIVTRNGSAVDTDGKALISLANGAAASMEWRTNCAYRNEIDVWGEKGSVFTDKIFSKPADYTPVFHFRDVHGVKTTELGESGDHFVSMLQYFRSTVEDLQEAEAERDRIAKRAELLNRILSVSEFPLSQVCG
jgi:predicted dehydrogenase